MSESIGSESLWVERNNQDFPANNSKGERLVIGCNYHTTWQSNKGMRFVLTNIEDGKARLQTRNTNKSFLVNADDLIFIQTEHNKRKAKILRP